MYLIKIYYPNSKPEYIPLQNFDFTELSRLNSLYNIKLNIKLIYKQIPHPKFN